ncbi:TetR/AcrR family transcriptional regulator [Streptomyces sp. NPDC021212]|uniref:TetR/AcrR family transcriptional regulator n=1 Tax=Streptomyces sp. NPDC021212 TaxID=3365118 RepID=UPI003788148C
MALSCGPRRRAVVPKCRQTGGGRPQRSDARTNRERILSVAEEVFGQGGRSASTEEVARLAGVGIATVFRHFPTKAALLEAVLVQRFDRLREQAEVASRHGPGGGVLRLLPPSRHRRVRQDRHR